MTAIGISDRVRISAPAANSPLLAARHWGQSGIVIALRNAVLDRPDERSVTVDVWIAALNEIVHVSPRDLRPVVPQSPTD